MKRHLIGIMASMMLLACLHSASALSARIDVNPETQAKEGLEFTLTTTLVRDNALIVRLETPKKGKLKNLVALQLELSDKEMTLLLTPLGTTEHDGVVTASFQISNYLMPGCHINLYVEVDPLYSIDYSVRLKDYIPGPAKQ